MNAGSSSLKLAAFEGERLLNEPAEIAPPDAVGHRIVHGGSARWQPCLIDDAVLADIEAAAVYAPNHQPASLAAIRIAMSTWPDVPQVACFDTAFHHDLPLVAQTLPVPAEPGLRRYGFHGLSFEWVVSTLGPALGARAVIAHLGSGASLAAVLHGRPHDTTMGLTPIGGLMMGTRTGDIDPGTLVHLMRQHDLDAEGLAELVEHRSGLLGVSGTTADMKTLLGQRATDPSAALAIDLWVLTVRKHVAAMAASLGGVDTLVFTGGIGERSAELRAEICAGLGFLEPYDLHVVETDENRVVARHTSAVLAAR